MHSAVHCVFSAVAQLDAVCQLAVMFIANVSISGYSVTANVHSKVDALLSVTSRHILTLLHDKCIKLVNSYVTFVDFCTSSIWCFLHRCNVRTLHCVLQHKIVAQNMLRGRVTTCLENLEMSGI